MNSSDRLMYSVFENNFNIDTVPRYLLSKDFMITAIVHKAEYIQKLDKYFQIDDFPYLFMALEHQDKLDQFLGKVKFTKNLEKFLIGFFTRTYNKNLESLAYQISSFDYKFVRDNGAVASLENHSDIVHLNIKEMILRLSRNKSLPYPLVKHCENILLMSLEDDIKRIRKKLSKSLYSDSMVESLARHVLDTVQQLPNYSAAKYVLEAMNDTGDD